MRLLASLLPHAITALFKQPQITVRTTGASALADVAHERWRTHNILASAKAGSGENLNCISTSYKWLYLISNRRNGGYKTKFKMNATPNPRSPVVFAMGPVNQT